MRGDLIEISKIIRGILNYDWHFLKYFSFKRKFTVKADFKKWIEFFFANSDVFLEKNNGNSVKKKRKKNELNGLRKKWLEKEFKMTFWEPSDKLLNRIWSEYWYCINCLFYAKIPIFKKGRCEKIVKRRHARGGITNKKKNNI